MMKNVEKQGKLDMQVKQSLKCAQTIDELNHVYAPYKGDKKHSLADRARALGLEEASKFLLEHPKEKINLRIWVRKGVEGRSTLSDVEKGVRHLICDFIAKHPSTLEQVRKIFQNHDMMLESKVSTVKLKSEADLSSKVSQQKQTSKDKSDHKYQLYYNFRCQISKLKSYQVLAINRGEAQKQLTVKVLISDRMEDSFIHWYKLRWLRDVKHDEVRDILLPCIEDSYNRLIKPLVLRKARSDLTKSAHMTSVEVFCRNLRKLLLTAPVRGKAVLGVDPGFKNGCKCAILSSTGNVILATDIFNLRQPLQERMGKLRQLYQNHKFEVVGIGNGTACRETEQFISTFIKHVGNPNLVYCIVNEDGASIYSVTKEAETEMPNLDPNLRSAVSIARRLQDPLVELVKIEPKHLGVGMYQHDIASNMLKAALSSVVVDCVTLVGVDLNVAGPSLLSHVAGLKAGQVKKILDWRKKNGKFINRQQLLEVPGIGAKTYQQCAGFMRISQKNVQDHENCIIVDDDSTDETIVGRKRKNKFTGKTRSEKKRRIVEHTPNLLDQTWIHPEAYEVTKKLLNILNCPVSKLGTQWFINQIENAVNKGMKSTMSSLASQLGIGEPTLQLIIDGLTQPFGFRDIREESSKPLYRRGLEHIEDLHHCHSIHGRVTNVTDFGVFVDVGVGQDGLIHMSEMQGRWEELKYLLGPNDVIKVRFKNMDVKKSRLSFRLVDAQVTKPKLI
ncbi:S1 RNA-binding domain-containing protein 1-like isoform X2 [Clavelina lepadiformis]